MLAPISWLKDYVDINVSPEVLAKKLVAIGFEVEEIIYQEKAATKVVVGKIVKVEKHPNADRLRVTQIDTGDKTIQVVTNVPVEGGEIIAVALDGAALADGHKIVKGELRGVTSEGMLCGLEEVGATADMVENQKAGDILRFSEGVSLGTNAMKALGLTDVILDVSVTANRPDCNSIYKLAKEVAVALKTTCREPEIAYTVDETKGSVKDVVSVEVKNQQLCPRYMAAGVTDIKIFQSPYVIRKRLRAVGIRPINNIVDITNYVLIEIGQPMHAFDKRELDDNKIIVRTAKTGEHLISLDGKDNTLTESMLVICDADKPVAIAGIMGGENSGIKDDTQSIVFESAKFARDSVRRTSRALNLRSDSSARFEKGVDFASQEYGIKRALTLIAKTGSGSIQADLIDVSAPFEKERKIEFTTKKLQEILGCKVPKGTLISILNRLGIAVTEGDKCLIATVREDREDIVGVNDLAEEFIRVYGYGHITPTLFEYSRLTKGGETPEMLFVNKIKTTLAATGLNECTTYSFVSPKFADMLLLAADDDRRKCVPLVNPLAENMSVMRTMLAHSMIETLTGNLTHFNKSASLFEVAKVYKPKALPVTELPNEESKLVIGAYGDGADFFTMKGYVDQLMYAFNFDAKFEKADISFMHPGRCAKVFVDGEEVGYLGELHPDAASSYGVDIRLYVAELSVDVLFGHLKDVKKFKLFSKFPPVERDLAVVVDENVVAGDMLETVNKGKIAFLTSANVFDSYKSEQIGKGKKSIAMNFTFASLDRTLKDEEVSAEMQKILSLLKRKFGAKIR